MIELNLKHVLLFIIVIFLLYLLKGDCGDPFSVDAPDLPLTFITPTCAFADVPAGKKCIGNGTIYNIVNNKTMEKAFNNNTNSKLYDGDCFELKIPDGPPLLGQSPIDIARSIVNGYTEYPQNLLEGKCSKRTLDAPVDQRKGIKNYTKLKDNGYISYSIFGLDLMVPYSIFVEADDTIGNCNPYILKNDIGSCDNILIENKDDPRPDGISENIILCDSAQTPKGYNCFTEGTTTNRPLCTTDVNKCKLSQKACNQKYCSNVGECEDTSADPEGIKCINCCGHSGDFCQKKINDDVILENNKCGEVTCSNQKRDGTCPKGLSCKPHTVSGGVRGPVIAYKCL